MRKVIGMIFVIMGLLTYIAVFSVVIQYSLLLAMIVSLPVFFLVLVGCSLVLGGGLKRAALWEIMFMALTMFPWVVFLPAIWQIVSLTILGILLALLLIWYRKKWKSFVVHGQTEGSD